MKKTVDLPGLLLILGVLVCLLSCSKSGSSSGSSSTSGSGSGGSGNNSGTGLIPLAVSNTWNYKLREYNTGTGQTTDSSYFTLSVTGQVSVKGVSYFQLQNSVDPGVMNLLTNTNSNTLGSVDSAFGVSTYTFFVNGTGDSTTSVNSWPIEISSNGTSCQGTAKLYANYADTTLVNLDGTTYTQSIKNVILSLDCSGNKMKADVYFVKQGVGMVRLSRYIYGSGGQLLLKSAWVLESESLQQSN